MVVNHLWFLLQEMGLVDPHRITYDWQELPCTRETFLYHSKLQARFDRRFSTIGKSLRFTIPYSKANNKSKSVWWSIHPAPKSLPCIRFSESRILTLGHPRKHCRISLVDELSLDNSMDSASQTNIYCSFTTLRFCVTPIRSSADKCNFFQGFPSARMHLLLGRSWGLWVMAHLITCKPWNHHRGQLIITPTSSFLAFLNPSNCIVSLPSIGTKLRRDYSDSSWICNCSIFPTSYLLYIQ